ncbi:MAG: DUF5615 family PIN-like protein [Armatimonadetes bacterium]|nr:DUF5615 family PIN-like protein [Armatimonadota bacterium]
MKFLLDACVSSKSLRDRLKSLGHDVSSALEIDPRATDKFLMELARSEERVILTEDKDFGELVFLKKLRIRGSYDSSK